MGKRIAGGPGVLASIAGILGLLVALNIIHPFGPPKTLASRGMYGVKRFLATTCV